VASELLVPAVEADDMQTSDVVLHARIRPGVRALALAASVLVMAGFLGGCVHRVEKQTSTPAASPSTTVVVTQPQRTVNYPEGRYELYGDGRTTPYYWVWVPAGATPPAPPPPPKI